MSLQKFHSDKLEVGKAKSLYRVKVPTSKSFANRLLILAALSKDEITIKNMPKSTDVKNLIQSLKAIGLNISVNEKSGEIRVINHFPNCEYNAKKISKNSSNNNQPIILQTGDGGTTNRFLIALLALGQQTYKIIPSLHMIDRPMEDLFTVLKKLEVKVEIINSDNEHFWIIQGPISIKKNQLISMDCSKSTQFASAIQMVLPNIDLQLQNFETSTDYFKMTKFLIDQFQKGIDCFTVPADASSLGYPLAIGAIISNVEILEFKEIDCYQADGIFIKILKQMGCKITKKDSTLYVFKSDLSAINWDCRLCPDLVPTLAFVCSYAKGKSELTHINVLRFKESDRLEQLFRLFKQFKIIYSYDQSQDKLTIEGRISKTVTDNKIEKQICTPEKDHRMVMVSFLYLLKNSGGTVSNASNVQKSYPHFFDDFN